MEKVVTSSSLRSQLSHILDNVQFERNSYVVERRKKPAVAIIPISVYEAGKEQRAALFAQIAEFQEASGDNDPEATLELVVEAQEAIRREESEA